MHIMIWHWCGKTYCDIKDEGNKKPKQIFFPNLLPTQQLDEKPLYKASPTLHYPSAHPLILMPYSFISKPSSTIKSANPSLVESNLNRKKLSPQDMPGSDMTQYGYTISNGQIQNFPFYLHHPYTKVRWDSLHISELFTFVFLYLHCVKTIEIPIIL